MKATVNDFVFKVNIPEDNFSFSFPFYFPVSNPIIDWGDGTTGTPHIYEKSGEYEIVISGGGATNIIFFDMNYSSASREYVTEIVQWGKNLVLLGQKFLSGFTNLVSLPSDTSGVSFNSYTERTEDFKNCAKLKSIPSDFYNNYTAEVTTLTSLFEGCSSLTGLSSSVLSPFRNTVVTINRLFYGCTGLQTFTESLFYNFTQLRSIHNLFYGCISLQSVGSNIFNGCSLVKDISGLFGECTSLSQVPSNLFNVMVELQSAPRIFYASGLTTVPADIFKYNDGIMTFDRCFSNLTKLSPSAITPYGSQYGTVIQLWDRATNPNYPSNISGIECYANSNFSNSASIPANWK